MSDYFDDDESEEPDRPVILRRRRPRIALALAALIFLVALLSVFTSVWTEKLWFQSIGEVHVFQTLLGTKVALFAVFGVLMALVVGVNIVVAYRLRPVVHQRTPEEAGLERYRDLFAPMRRLITIGTSLVFGLFAGGSAVGQWRDYLMWAHRQPFRRTDPWFHKDIGFYVFSLPWLHYLIDFAMVAIVIGLIAALLTHYVYGGVHLQAAGERFTTGAQRHVCVLLGLLVLFKGIAYYLNRFDLTTKNGSLITGMTYTREHAVLPSQNVLMVIAAICAVLFFVSVWRTTWLLPGVGIGLFAFTAILLGIIWPAVVQKFQVDPNKPDKESSYIADSIAATRAGYDLENLKVTDYPAKTTLGKKELAASADSLPGVRLLDPSIMSSTFQQLQQVRGYYSVPGLLDLDRYEVDGRQRDLVVAARELRISGLPQAQRKWTNDHTVYTHGYGLIAAYGNQRDRDNVAKTNDGEPIWAEKDIPPTGVLGSYEPRIYYGENSPSYSIVGHPKGAADVELDHPGSDGTGDSTTTMYTGPGVPVGSLFHKLLYAAKFGDSNIVLSSRVNADSKILYDRSPEERVQKVAPWLTLDSDAFPAVVDGQIKWIIDGYTTSNRFAGSAKRSMTEMTSDSAQPRSTYATLPSDQINYIRNSVKATVDAYTGEVTLYAWEPDDPILIAMEHAFPGLVQPKSSIPTDLREHFRYPEDLFKVQRDILTDYHVDSPSTFFADSDKWAIPDDPSSDSATARRQTPYRLSVSVDGRSTAYSLTSVYTPYLKQNLAAFISVNSDATSKDYGRLDILRLPDKPQTPGPENIANNFTSDPEVAERLRNYRNQSAQVENGNLLTLPVGGGFLYVQPVYALRSSGSGSYPTIAFVEASFGRKVGVGNTLSQALAEVLGTSKAPSSGTSTDKGASKSSGDNKSGPSDPAWTLLQRADAKFTAADKALRSGDLTRYAKLINQARSLVERALDEHNSSPGQRSGAAKRATSGATNG